jgi:hypothetical protein
MANARIELKWGLALGLVVAGCGGDETADGGEAGQTQAGPDGGPDGGPGSAATEDPPTTGESADDGTSAGTATDTGDPPEPPAVVDVPLRRLTQFEYRRTVEDLFAPLALPAFELPVDDLREGFDNNADALIPTKLHIEQYNAAAEAIAAAAAADLPALIDCTPDTDPNCSRRFVSEFGARAFRRPLTAEEALEFHRFFEMPPGDASFAAGVEVTIQLMLQAPQFLYRIELHEAGGAPGELADLDPYQVASRMSYFLWGSMPDAPLFAAAAGDALATPAQIEAEARRMLDDPKAERAFLHFFTQWADMGRIDLVTKLADDGYDEATRASMRQEFERFVGDVLFTGEASFADLLQSNRTFVDDRLAGLYGVTPPGPDVWAEVELDPAQRAGLFTQTAFLASHGHPLNPSPVKRGNYMLQNLLCTSVGSPPPIAEAMNSPKPQPGMTNRQVYEQLTGADQCKGCHMVINPVGFAFEHYDTMGRFRLEDQGLPVDASGSFQTMSYADAIEFMAELSASELAQSCFSRKWLVYGLGGAHVLPEMATDAADAFAAAEFNLRELQVAIATHPRFRSYRVAP